jgi:hypothetical protein
VRGAALCLVPFLATPYMPDYGLMLLAPAIPAPGAEGKDRAFSPSNCRSCFSMASAIGGAGLGLCHPYPAGSLRNFVLLVMTARRAQA